MTAGTDGKTLDGMSMARVNRIIVSLKDHSYQPQPAKRKYIAKKNSSKKRPLGIPSTDDKLVQEVVRVMLEAIYKSGFSVHSHGFRPNQSCHTCLAEVKRTFIGVKWFIEGDIKGCFDNIDHHMCVNGQFFDIQLLCICGQNMLIFLIGVISFQVDNKSGDPY